MPQTLLAIGALLIFSLFALSQHRAKSDLESKQMASEMELAAAALAQRHLTHITRYAFDEADVNATTLRTRVSDLPTLTAPPQLGRIRPDEADETGPSTNDDVDDFHGELFTFNWPWNGKDLPLQVSTVVTYIDEMSSQPSGSETLAKRVSVTVAEPNPPPERPPVTVTLSKVVTPAWSWLHR